MKIRSRVVAILAASAVALTLGPTAFGVTYTWRNAASSSGTLYTETSAAGSFSRTGVEAQIISASGPTWNTNVRFGSYQTTNSDSGAAISGPRSYLVTKAKFVWLPHPGVTDKMTFQVWLLDAKMAGTSRTVEAPSIQLSIEELREGGTDEIEVAKVGTVDGVDVWSGEINDDRQVIYLSHGDYVGGGSVSSETFSTSGITLTFGNDDFTATAYAGNAVRDTSDKTVSVSGDIAVSVVGDTSR